ncbi:MAG TPA: PEGA domain-containing protein, partial [Kofleriaceae bacterium]|nr:PEGA domain-containing protein [Kofleriaceae bacterium]
MARRVASLLIAASVIAAQTAPVYAQPSAPTGPSTGPEEALDKKIAVWRFDALGIDAEIVQKLETLFRLELDRLDKVPLPSRRDIESKITASEQNCTGEEKCLQAIGKRLAVDYVVTGTVGSLGDNYVLNIKAVEVATGKSQKIQSPPLKGTPDELIEGVRVAAYSLLAPDQLHGSLQVQSDLVGAEVTLDGKPVGKTPLMNQGVIARLALGKHKLHVEAKDYAPFDDDVDVHFQKVSPVVVRLVGAGETIGTGKTITKG